NTIVIEPPMHAAAKAIEIFKEWIYTYKELQYNNQAVKQILEQELELEHNQVIEYKENEQNFKHKRNTETIQLIV
ncbi:8736_t:CDS:2, partial [Dentiscutata erythropus]